MDPTYGLGWNEDYAFDIYPIWTVEPSVELISEIAHRKLQLSDEDIAHTTVEFKFQGAFNKLYAVECPRGSYFMRITLPVHPHFKTSSEVATIALLELKTSIRVPHIIASSSTSDNELKFEWILMERIHGSPLADVWPSIPWAAKVSCVKEVAHYLAELFRSRYDGIGNLFHPKDLGARGHKSAAWDPVMLGQLMSMEFFWRQHIKSNVYRGPFASSKDWLEVRFQLMEEDCMRVLNSQESDEADIKVTEPALQLLNRLRKQLPIFFPSNSAHREEFALYHRDVNRHNLILDSNGKLQGLVDWECVSVMPLWQACQIPRFLCTPDRTEKPDPKLYLSVNLDDEYDMYRRDLHEFECTLLRGYFLEEMAILAPRWLVVYEESKSKRNFDLAMEMYDLPFVSRSRINNW